MNGRKVFIVIISALLLLAGCTVSELEITQEVQTARVPPSAIPPSDTPFELPPSEPSDTSAPPTLRQGITITVTNPSDSDPGSLREALEIAQDHDAIIFDSAEFPPGAPVTISITSTLPHIDMNNLTLDASNAGVILDGSQVPGDWTAGLQIVNSSGNIIRGFKIANFSGPGIAISGDSKNNVVGGDPGQGTGPNGQGNVLTNNNVGVSLAETGTISNTITGNLIGMDLVNDPELGRQTTGVSIVEGANGNTIGPANLIAYNSWTGVHVSHEGTLNNTITRNSIHHNGWKGIYLQGGNDMLAPPLIFDFNLTAGTIVGAACPNCEVEIFSNSDLAEVIDEHQTHGDVNGGEIYEGSAIADGNGLFTFSQDSAFAAPHLTATNTDRNGSTSVFSWSGTVTAGVLEMQRGNNLLGTVFQPKQSGELVDNRIAAQFDSFGPGEKYDLGIYNLGVKRARVAIAGLEPELVDWAKPEFNIDSSHDEVFTRMSDKGLTITYVLTFWDKDTYPSLAGVPCSRFESEAEVERYKDFVFFIVDSFIDRVQYFEIWNEPDIVKYCPKWIRVENYKNLVRQVVPAVKDEYPDAKFVVGSVSNTAFPEALDYLADLVKSDIMPLVDVISWHPMYGTSPEYEIYHDYYYGYPEMVSKIKLAAEASGFSGEYQADEIGWSTPSNAVQDQPWVYSPIKAAKYLGRGIIMHLGMDVGVGVGDGENIVRSLSTVMAGAEPVNQPIQIQSQGVDIVVYSFSLPDEGSLIALWTDSAAVDLDPGVETVLTIPDFSASSAAGIDVLYGYEQELITEIVDGNLVIKSLLVKDYPLIIRFTDAASP